MTDEAGKLFQADIYAEGDVRITGRETAPKLKHRAVLRTAKQIQLSPYKPTGLTAFKEPPVGLKILQRSGLQQPSPPATGQAQSKQSAPPPQSRPRAVTESSLTAPLEAGPSPLVGSAGASSSTSSLPDLEPVPTAVPPRKDPQVQLAQLVRRQPADAQAPAADQTAQAAPAPAAGAFLAARSRA